MRRPGTLEPFRTGELIMSMALELLIYIALFALALGLLDYLLGDTNSEKRKMRAEHERQRLRHRDARTPRTPRTPRRA
jgi:hypothetical protein